MRSHSELKQLLEEVTAKEYRLPEGIDTDKLADDMLVWMGDTDLELRDKLIYSTFAELFDSKQFSPQQIKRILYTAMDDKHLFHGIGEKGTDTVFMRAFSILIIPIALDANGETPFLSDEEVLHVKDTVLRYIREEQDTRGYVEEKGWAHAIAHGADALWAVAECDAVDADSLKQVLAAIETAIKKQRTAYGYEEDERLTTAFIEIYEREVLSLDDIKSWVKALASYDEEGQHHEVVSVKISIKNFMRSVYFRLPEGDILAGFVRQYCNQR